MAALNFVRCIKISKMNLLKIAIVLILLSGCKKEKHEKCYHCTFGIYNGQIHPPVDYCGDDGGTRRFQDDQGNDLSSQCLEVH